MFSSLSGSGKAPSLKDRAIAAKYTISGDNLSKIIFKATTEEIKAPKPKHIDYLVASTNDPNISIPQTANMLIVRSYHKSWVVVFKTLVTFHNLTIKGNERFMQFNSTNGSLFSLLNFSDNTTKLSYQMSIPIRNYSNYLNEKILSYRSLGYDLTRISRGKDNGVLRNMSTEKLLIVLPVTSKLMDALMSSQFKSSEVFNGVINSAFKLLYLDAIRLFACYNDGIIKMLELYFDMDKNNCKKCLDLYNQFLQHSQQMTTVIKNAAEVGIDTHDVPELSKAPTSILESLTGHYASLENKVTSTSKTNRVTGQVLPIIAPGNSSTATNGQLKISEIERRQVIEEEENYLKEIKKMIQSKPAVLNISNNAGTNKQVAVANPFLQNNEDLLDNDAMMSSYNPFLEPSTDPFNKKPLLLSDQNVSNYSDKTMFWNPNMLNQNNLNNAPIPYNNYDMFTNNSNVDLFSNKNFQNTLISPNYPVIGNEENYFKSISKNDLFNVDATQEKYNNDLVNPVSNLTQMSSLQKVPAVYAVPPAQTISSLANSNIEKNVQSSAILQNQDTKNKSNDLDSSLAILGGNLALNPQDKWIKYNSQANLNASTGRQLTRESVDWTNSENKSFSKTSGLSSSAWSLNNSSEPQLSLQKSNSIFIL